MFNKKENGVTPEIEKNQKYALLSVSNKEDIVDFARTIYLKLGYRIISTGGTGNVLGEGGVPFVPIQEITGNPECFEGRMKTISFQIESGILYDRTKPSQQKEAQEFGIKPIDLVVCNLYPFEKTIQKPSVTFEEAIENIDVGGPTMVRAAAKNHKNVLVVVDPRDYQRVAEALQKGTATEEFRREMAAKAFFHLSLYDSLVARYLNKELFPEEMTIPGRKIINLRYGENPHQDGAFYSIPNTEAPLNKLKRITGRELSLINLTDINAGIESVRFFDTPAAVVIKHNSPCGIALGRTSVEALVRAIESDPDSAFGGVAVLNWFMDVEATKVLRSFKDERKSNMDIVAVPGISDEAVELLKNIRETLGIYTFGEIPKQRIDYNMKPVEGGFVLQTADSDIEESFEQWEVVSKVKPTAKQLEQMEIAWKFISRIRSNSVIVVDKDLPMTRGIGSGQTSRFRSTKIALEQAGKFAKGGILASDSFFPFGDSTEHALRKEIGAIVQQGGSVNDKDSINLADKAGIPMVFTHRRAFWH